MATGSEGSSTVDFDELFPPRIDELVESALQEQQREQQMLIDTVQGAQKEMKALRELVDRRDQSVVDLLEARLSGLASEGSLEKVREAMSKYAEGPDFTEGLAPVSEQIGAIGGRLENLGKTLEAVEKGLERLDPWKPALEVQRALTNRLGEIATDIRDQIEERYGAVGEKIDEASKTQLEQLGKKWEALSNRIIDATANLQGKVDQNLTTIATKVTEGSAANAKVVNEKSASVSRLVTNKASLLTETVN